MFVGKPGSTAIGDRGGVVLALILRGKRPIVVVGRADIFIHMPHGQARSGKMRVPIQFLTEWVMPIWILVFHQEVLLVLAAGHVDSVNGVALFDVFNRARPTDRKSVV